MVNELLVFELLRFDCIVECIDREGTDLGHVACFISKITQLPVDTNSCLDGY